MCYGQRKRKRVLHWHKEIIEWLPYRRERNRGDDHQKNKEKMKQMEEKKICKENHTCEQIKISRVMN